MKLRRRWAVPRYLPRYGAAWAGRQHSLCYDFGVTSLGIYIQVPFCQTKCTYCNFHTGVVSAERFTPYVDAVCAEIGGTRLFTLGQEWSCRRRWRMRSSIVFTLGVGRRVC